MWRKLRALGAVPLRKSVYLLPPTPDNFERFQWLSQEVQKDGGEATFLSVENVENMKRAEVIRLFQQVRDQDYRALVERYRKLARGLDRKTPVRSTSRRNEELTRLARELERIREIGVRRAVGATQKDILFQFLSEAVMISVAGGVAGIVVGTALSAVIQRVAAITTIVSVLSVILAFGVSITVGIAFGIMPAHRAARQDPVVCLRYE